MKSLGRKIWPNGKPQIWNEADGSLCILSIESTNEVDLIKTEQDLVNFIASIAPNYLSEGLYTFGVNKRDYSHNGITDQWMFGPMRLYMRVSEDSSLIHTASYMRRVGQPAVVLAKPKSIWLRAYILGWERVKDACFVSDNDSQRVSFESDTTLADRIVA
jgi:hypothetical protein